MKVCKNCGAHLDDSAPYCPLCGAEQQPPYAQNADNQQYTQQNYNQNDNQNYNYNQGYNQYDPYDPQYSQANNGQYNYQQPYNQQFDPRYVNLQNEISTVKTLGIVSIIGLFFAGLVTIVCSIIGIVKGNGAISQARMLGDPLLIQQAEDAKRLNKIALIILAVLAVLGVLAVIILASAGIMSGYNY